MDKIENTYTCTYVTIIIRGEAIIWEEWEAWVGLPGEGGMMQILSVEFSKG